MTVLVNTPTLAASYVAVTKPDEPGLIASLVYLVTVQPHEACTEVMTNGALPDDLQLSNSGVISGIPRRTGVFQFTIQVSDGFRFQATKVFTISVNAPPVLLSLSDLPESLWNSAGADLLTAFQSSMRTACWPSECKDRAAPRRSIAPARDTGSTPQGPLRRKPIR